MTGILDGLPTWALSAAATRSHQILQRRLNEAGATGYEYRCLTSLADHDGVSQAALGTMTSLDPRDVTHTVRALEARGLVGRAADPTHGRRVLVSLTPDGRVAAAALVEVMSAVQDEVFAQLDGEERAHLLRLLAKTARTEPPA